MDASYWAQTFATALGVCSRWVAEQQRSVGLLVALAEFHSRFHALSQTHADHTLGVLTDNDGVQMKLQAKHLRGMENLMAALRRSIGAFEAQQAELGALHAAVWGRYVRCADGLADAEAGRPQHSIVGAGQGRAAQAVEMPSALQCVEWVAELDGLCCQELLLKLQLMDRLSYEMQPELLGQLVRLWSLRAFLTDEPIQRLQALVASLKVDTC